MEKRERDILLDVVRGFAMVCVVLGHCIQEGSGLVFSENTFYFQDRVYQFLYSFHMPLFMLISGYFAWKSVDQAETIVDRWKMLYRKCAYLLVPIFGWGLIDQLNAYIQNQIKDYQLLPKYLLQNAIVYILTNLWFLWAILICFLLVCMMHYIFRDTIWMYAGIFIIMFVTPDGLGLGVYKYMVPYYLIGFYFHRYLEKAEKKPVWKDWHTNRKVNFYLLLLSGAMFLLLFLLFEEKYFIYLTGYKLLGKQMMEQLWIDGYRFLIGFMGSIFFVMLLSLTMYVKKNGVWNNMLAFIGQKSLGIYILSGYVIMYVVRNLAADLKPNYFMNIIECIVVLVLSVILYVAIEKIPYMKKLIGVK